MYGPEECSTKVTIVPVLLLREDNIDGGKGLVIWIVDPNNPNQT